MERAHANGLWIRFYTLDGATEQELSCRGWFRSYNFGSLDAARIRWRAAMAACAPLFFCGHYGSDDVSRAVRAEGATSGRRGPTFSEAHHSNGAAHRHAKMNATFPRH